VSDQSRFVFAHDEPVPSPAATVPQQSAQIDLPTAKDNRDRGMARAAAHAAEDFAADARMAIWKAAQAQPTLIVDDVWRFYAGAGTHENRAMGPAMVRAVKEGWLERTNEFRPSAQSQCHANPRRVWRSRIYRGES
jgi:hypothetical protein